MKTIKKVPIIAEYVEFIPKTADMKQGVIYISKRFRTASHICLCGKCGNRTVTPLKKGEWELTDKNGKISLSESIGNFQYPCKSHYIIVNGNANFV